MKKTRIALFGVCCAVAALTACIVVALAFINSGASPVLVKEDPQARQTAQALLDAVSTGDYQQASAYMLGTPDMGADRNAEDPVGVLIWQAYQESLTFTPAGECYATASGVAYDYEVRHLDLDQVTGKLRERSQALLTERVEQAKDVSEVYDENNEYREDFVLNVLLDAAKQALEEDSVLYSETFCVHLVCREDRWWVVPDEGLLRAITGNLAG